MTIADTTSGRVRGTSGDGVTVFRGIPYAAPPIGARRFRAPAAVQPWTGVRDALEFGPYAMQTRYASDVPVPQPESEDCLTLNVWTPVLDGRLPVLVDIHGGGFHGGGATADASRIVRDGEVIVVSFAHRLAAMGYLYLDGIREGVTDANAGLLDLVAGLQWVRDNIAAFGGDPARVTVMGCSGGGWKISNLLAMPLAAGLFHGAILQSGSYAHATTPEEADDYARRLLHDLDIPLDRLDRLAGLPAAAFMQPDPRPDELNGRVLADATWQWGFRNGPVLDGTVLPREPFAPDSPPISAEIPLLIGVTRDELPPAVGDEFASGETDPVAKVMAAGLARERAERAVEFYRAEGHHEAGAILAEFINDRLFQYPALLQAERRIALGGAPVFEYLYSWKLPHAGGRAMHGGDHSFVYGNFTPETYPALTQQVEDLAWTIRMAVAAFVHHGDPSHSGLPRWAAYDLERRSTMVFDAESRLDSDPRRDRRRLVESEART